MSQWKKKYVGHHSLAKWTSRGKIIIILYFPPEKEDIKEENDEENGNAWNAKIFLCVEHIGQKNSFSLTGFYLLLNESELMRKWDSD